MLPLMTHLLSKIVTGSPVDTLQRLAVIDHVLDIQHGLGIATGTPATASAFPGLDGIQLNVGQLFGFR